MRQGRQHTAIVVHAVVGCAVGVGHRRDCSAGHVHVVTQAQNFGQSFVGIGHHGGCECGFYVAS